MTEQDFDQDRPAAAGTGDATTAAATTGAPETGHAAVDAVIASLAGLGARPVDEHVAVFERAHEQLRGALDAPAGPRPPAMPGPQG